ncbi:hypothetical protein BGW36DRAFT_386136 [Talaromyces proteolyticus]|uniref:Zn(2)-C6 fungal-type domain-containing protein n=1 Tax=Talaromyces proteolyticus TaxID=1131652 RepID=A0AAD4KM10_9EURO|nr:uncharacterized protein BGW36DRAFT_386136 [Talaromyces proteolyticus]KAH8693207.1 hypothetical protein BGW36DRAFT_386136 [Talaromyces proteolyticus]
MTESASAKKTRAGKPKVRTGCQTCKVRRVKCDEQKPFCLRCRNLNLQCQGYPAPIARRRKKTSILSQKTERSSRLLAPSGSHTHTLPSARSPCPEQVLLPVLSYYCDPRIASSRHHQLAEGDVVYFDYFRYQVANNLAGFYTTSIWSRLAAGEGLQDDCIRHSVLSIGAFMRSMAEPAPSLCNSTASGGGMSRTLMLNRIINNKHQEAALQHHAKATTSFHRNIQYLTLSTPSKVVITTLLLAVFELLQGQMNVANLLVNSSIDFLGSFPSRKYFSDHEFQEVEWVLPLVSTMSQLSLLLRPRSHDIRTLQMTVDSRFPEPNWDSLLKIFTSWGRFFTSSIMLLQQTLLYGLEQHTPNNALDQLIPQQEALLSQLRRWQAILEECGKSSHLEPSRKITMRLIQIHWLLLYITINCCLDSTQMMYDLYDAEFRQLCAQCKDMIRDSLSHQRPTSVLLGEGLILSLTTVIRCCRNHDIRMMAAEAARQIPASMIVWDVRELLDNLLAAVLLEELGRDDTGVIPPHSRWTYLETDPSQQKSQKPDRIYQRLVPNEAGIAVYTRLTIASDLRSDICNAARCRKVHTEL